MNLPTNWRRGRWRLRKRCGRGCAYDFNVANIYDAIWRLWWCLFLLPSPDDVGNATGPGGKQIKAGDDLREQRRQQHPMEAKQLGRCSHHDTIHQKIGQFARDGKNASGFNCDDRKLYNVSDNRDRKRKNDSVSR